MPRSLKFLLFLVILAILLPFILRDKDGQPLLKLRYFTAPKVAVPDLSGVKEKGRRLVGAVQQTFERSREAAPEPAAPMTIYKWRGDDGAWVFSDQPNPSGECQQVLVDPRAAAHP